MNGIAGFRSGADFRAVGRHHEYYLAGGDLFFLVEQMCIFRVHRFFFTRESSYFRKQLGTPPSPNPSYESIGSSDSSAVLLEGVTVEEFAKFLWVFYNPSYDLYDTTTDDWAIILRLADKWDFPRVKELSIRHLEVLGMADIERVALYQDHKVDKALLVRWYAALCAREEPLTIEEGEKLKIHTAMTIARAREILRSPTRGTSLTCSTPVDMEESALHTFIRSAFQIPGGSILSPSPKSARPPITPAGVERLKSINEVSWQDQETTDRNTATPDGPHRTATSPPPLKIDDSVTRGVFGKGRGRKPPSTRF